MKKPNHHVLTKYRGEKDEDGVARIFIMSFDDVMKDRDGTELSPNRSRSAMEFSETFDWGVDNDGCRQAAHAVILEATNDEMYANRHYEAFIKDFYLSDPLRQSWTFGQHTIREWALKQGYNYIVNLRNELFPDGEANSE